MRMVSHLAMTPESAGTGGARFVNVNIASRSRTYDPRTVLVRFGADGVPQNANVSSAPQRLSTLIDPIPTAVPGADVFV
ncbi:hypothetical protein AB0O34_36000 [Sphaerisporangium sp. NPDC088356]|uniref:hypothetical protein n=1 Tax=Sphaerisporangium sp. NPDC088356 TaxID=3154871 RepID=UPI003420C36D